MDNVNRSCFKPKITEYTDDSPETLDLPAKLWKAINDHHSGGQMSDEDLGQKLLISLNNHYFQDAKEIAIPGIKEYDKVVSELKKRLDAVAM
ncbi:hypothetical protein CROQUDRAFT_100913 [Cronartium quercuum f. sp. fusiforme G11]|uniref:Uncharacterized protein n=1 Tax=Cronartium quercuum f. sp. fusiforme G11 TaxID=708437 RepID=A0A9P6T5Y7_9BASI|nr:hypothetical protein CROQUDRAFT_100913 [Cronartium quercuum f. sp. fusiforme G11]